MEAPGSSAAELGGGGGTPGGGASRQEVNSAYANLEQMIKNFGREKLMYEQTIEGLQSEVQMGQERIQKMSLEIQDVGLENKRLEKVFEEDEKIREDLDNKVLAAEHQSEIIQEAVLGFEALETNMLRRYEDHEDFIACLKYRQLQLKQWIDETLKKNQVLQTDLDKMRSQLNACGQELTRVNLTMEENEKEYRRMIGDLRQEIQQHLQNLEGEKAAHLATVEGFKTVEGKFIEELKAKEKEEVNLKQFIDKLMKEIEEQGEEAAKELEKLTGFIEGKIKQHQEEKEGLSREMGTLDRKIEDLEGCLAAERGKSQATIESLKEVGVELEVKLVAKENENETLKLKVEEMEETLKRFQFLAEEEKKDLTMKLELEKGQREKERNELEKTVEEKNKVVMELREALETEKSEKVVAIENLEGDKFNLSENLKRKEVEAEGLKMEIDKLKGEMEEQKKVEDEEQAKLRKDLELKESKLGEEKAAFERQLEELNMKIEKCSEQLKEESAKNEAAVEELHQSEAKLKEELDAKESSLKTLMEQLEEKKVEMEGHAESFAKEKVEMEQEFQKEIKAVEEEKAKLVLDSTLKVEKLEKDLSRIRKERNEFYKRCLDHKQAIAKMAEQAGVRPLVLPKYSRGSQDNVPSTPPESAIPPHTPKTPLLRPVASKPDPLTTPSRSGILKRHSFHGEADRDKVTKNVTFGSKFIANFVVTSSDTDESSTQDEQTKENVPPKRMRFHEEKRDIGPLTPSQEEKDTEEMDFGEEEEEERGILTQKAKPERRFFKRGIAQKKSPNTTF